MFDDGTRIVENPHIRHLWPPWEATLGTTRPVVALSLALNYALGGLDVRGYHVFNLVLHLLAALALFGIVRRTLQGPRLRDRYGSAAPWLGLSVALVWVVHPLQTQSVTYLIQRAELLMGLFYLLTVYGVIRGVHAPRQRRPWHAAAIVSCALGMASKPIMVTAPLVVLLYDRVFWAASFREAWRVRRGLYLGLAATWGILAWLLVSAPGEYASSSGYTYQGITPLAYAALQPGVILHYLRLAVWPYPLLLDYDWPLTQTIGEILPPALIIGTLVLLTCWALRHRPALGFLGVWFFLILAPTSSLIPIAEHRLYLSLAALAVLVVVGGEAALRRVVASDQPRRYVGAGVAVALVAGLGTATIRRNDAYSHPVSFWRDVVMRQPTYARGHGNLGYALHTEGKLDEAIVEYTTVLRLQPDHARAHHNLGTALASQDRLEEAITSFAEAVRLQPGYPAAHYHLGLALAGQGRFEEAVTHFTESMRLDPYNTEMHRNVMAVLARHGKVGELIGRLKDLLADYESHASPES